MTTAKQPEEGLTPPQSADHLLPQTEQAIAETLLAVTEPVSAYTIPLSSKLSEPSALCPLEATIARIEPHGAVILCRFTDGEHAQTFELSAAEIEALVATNRRRKALLRRYQEQGSTPVLPF